MKKKLWIILGAALLLGVVLFLCFRQGSPAAVGKPTLPSIEGDQSPMHSPDPPGNAEDTAASSLPEEGDPARTGETRQSDPDSTDAELPVDWNQTPSASKPGGVAGSGSETPPVPASTETGESPFVEPNPTKTESEEETKLPEETGGQVVIPILPPDIFP